MSTPTEVRYVSVRVPEELLRRLRVRVAEEGETLQSVLLTLIESYVDEEEP
jgi:predicted DNA binding CopG/RHH family protein